MMELRRGRPADGDTLREIQHRALAEPWPELLEAGLAGAVPVFVVADGRPLGYATVLAGADAAYIPEIAVHPDRQGEGYGSELLTFLADWAAEEGCGALRLTVRACDSRARTFYERHGFEPRGRAADHFESGDGLLLSRPV